MRNDDLFPGAAWTVRAGTFTCALGYRPDHGEKAQGCEHRLVQGAVNVVSSVQGQGELRPCINVSYEDLATNLDTCFSKNSILLILSDTSNESSLGDERFLGF